MIDYVRDHPLMAAFFVACTVGGTIAFVAFPLFPGMEEMSLAKRALGGALAGAGAAMFPIVHRLFD